MSQYTLTHTLTQWMFFFFNKWTEILSFAVELSDPPPPPILSLHPQLDPGQLLSESHMVQIESNASYSKIHTKPPGFNTAYNFDYLCECKWIFPSKKVEENIRRPVIITSQQHYCLSPCGNKDLFCWLISSILFLNPTIIFSLKTQVAERKNKSVRHSSPKIHQMICLLSVIIIFG